MIFPPVLSARIDELAERRRVRIGVGLVNPDPKLIAELEGCARHADIVVVSPPTIELPGAWDVRTATQPEESLASMLVGGQVEGLLRGTLDGAKTIEAYMLASGDRDPTCPGLIEDASGRQFFLSAISNSNGFTEEQRLHETKLTANSEKAGH